MQVNPFKAGDVVEYNSDEYTTYYEMGKLYTVDSVSGIYIRTSPEATKNHSGHGHYHFRLISRPDTIPTEDTELSYLSTVVKIAKAVQDLSFGSSTPVAMPILAAVSIPDKGFRRKNIDSGTYLKIDSLKLGKRAGLIFVFKPDNAMSMSAAEFDSVELSWREFSEACPDLWEKLNAAVSVGIPDAPSCCNEFWDMIVEKMTISFASSPTMFKIATSGLERAMADRAKIVGIQPSDEKHPAYAMF